MSTTTPNQAIKLTQICFAIVFWSVRPGLSSPLSLDERPAGLIGRGDGEVVG